MTAKLTCLLSRVHDPTENIAFGWSFIPSLLASNVPASRNSDCHILCGLPQNTASSALN